MNYINNNRLILMTLSSLMMSGCIAKNDFQTNSTTAMKMPTQQAKRYATKTKTWKSISSVNKEDCVDCYAKPATAVKTFKVAKANNFKFKSKEVISYDYSKAPSDTFNNTIDYSKPPSAQAFSNRVMPKVAVDTYHYDAYDYTVTADDTNVKTKRYQTTARSITPQLSYVNSSRGNYSSKTAVQIGAFRRYAGAKSYAKKYDLLSSKYHVEIKTGVKDNQPLHRVRIEGFANRAEAKSFIARYGISDAFLVRR